jgi:exosortase/archaeosortase family protein
MQTRRVGGGLGGLRPAVRMAAALVWLFVIVAARWQPAAPVRVLGSFSAFVASVVQSLLGLSGIEASRAGTLLFVPGGFAYRIAIGCTGLLPAAVLTVAILASPGTGSAKRRGVLVGVPLVLAVNLLRMVHLFYLGVYSPRFFVLAHTVLWEAAIVLVVFATWLVWVRWAAWAGRQAGAVSAFGR